MLSGEICSINNEAAVGLQGGSVTFDYCRHTLFDLHRAILALFSSSSWVVLLRDLLGECWVRLVSKLPESNSVVVIAWGKQKELVTN